MNLRLERKWKKDTYTIGRLFIDDVFFSNTIEDCDRGLCQGQGEKYIKEHKKYGETAIPSGRYEIDMDTVSPKYSKQKRYMDICEGKVPRLKEVPGYEGVLIHIGNYAKDSLGCILVGKNDQKGMVTHSTDTFKKLYERLNVAHSKGEKIWITIS